MKDYLSFSRRDRLGVVSLLLLIALVYFLPLFFPSQNVSLTIQERKELATAADSLRHRPRKPPPSYSDNLSSPTPSAPFPFDPNVLDAGGWRRLGLPDRSIRTLLRYRDKGGRFHRPEDLEKIWGLPAGFYQRVRSFIRLPTPESPANNRPATAERRGPRPINLNQADSLDLLALPGIGPRLSSRLLAFRERLGGFHSPEQAAEVYGLPDSTFQQIRPYLQASGNLRRIKVNTASLEELKAHPYIRWKLAQAIVQYRQQHGPFNSLDELGNIHLMDGASLEKMRPYLEL